VSNIKIVEYFTVRYRQNVYHLNKEDIIKPFFFLWLEFEPQIYIYYILSLSTELNLR